MLLKLILVVEWLIVRLFSAIVPQRKLADENRLLLTGNFYSEAWIRSQLEVFEHSCKVKEVYMVAENPVPDIAKVTALYAPAWLNRVLGKDIARLVYFGWTAIRLRPQVLGGFHLLLNGLFAVLFAKLVGARAVYICGGGIREVLGGGYTTENRIFGRLKHAEPGVEKLLHKLVRCFDYVVVRGSKAKHYFVNEVAVESSNVHIITAGIDTKRFAPASQYERSFDMVFVGRISEVKRLHLVIEALAIINKQKEASLLVVGDGPDREAMEELADKLGVAEQVTFAGWQTEVEKFLNQSRLFLLTSSSEGLSQAMLQAMLSGLPALVSDVGDLGDVVVDGENGYLLEPCEPGLIAEKVMSLLNDPPTYKKMATSARDAALDYDIVKVSERWDRMLSR
ncbi:MAG: glycosyltransferase family 4 protein [Ketobacteraceae bacterium]|nr:glycosyltransferase family 4 protein [Ketobacteraceae bacterium]